MNYQKSQSNINKKKQKSNEEETKSVRTNFNEENITGKIQNFNI